MISKNKKWALTLTPHRLAVAIKFTFIAAVVIAFYFQDIYLVFRSALSDESSFHILAIPVLLGYLLCRKRRMFSATLKQTSQSNPAAIAKNFNILAGILFCATAVLVYWFGSYTFTPIEYHMLTLPVFSAGLILILFNGQTLKQLAFPIAFLFFLMPPPTEILYSVGSTLSDLSAHASNAIVSAFGVVSTISTQYGSPIITITRFDQTVMNFSIDVACSGVYSLIGFVIFAIFIAYINRGKLWSKFVILLAGIPLVIVLNIIRITTILTIGNSFGDELALQVFHTFGATVLMFIGTLILLVATEKFLKKPKSQAPCITCSSGTLEEFCSNCGKIYKKTETRLSKIDIAKIVSIAIIVALLLSIQAPVFALTEGPAEVLTQTPSGLQPNTQNLPLPKIQGYNLSFVYRDTDFEELSGQDASLAYSYSSSNRSKLTIWVAVEIAQTTVSLHRWETCLVNYPLSKGLKPSVSELDLRDIHIQENPPITARYFAFQYHNTNRTQVVLYWYETASFNIDNQMQQKHVKISLIVYPASPGGVVQAEELLLPIAEQVNNYWQPLKTWTAIALAISQNGLGLSAVTVALLVALIVYRLILNRQEKTSLLILYKKLPTQTQQLITAVQGAQKQGNPTTEGIAQEIEKQTNTPAHSAWLKEKLNEAENTGLIKKVLVNCEDKPAYAWRSQLPSALTLGSIKKSVSKLGRHIPY